MALIRLAIKVDVDTWVGLREGVPNLLDLFQRFQVPASFFIAFGPDNSGKAIRRVFKQGFLHKMWRINPLRAYGFKTLFYGTLLNPPGIGQGAPELLQRIVAEGHELGIHGYDHVLWQDGLERMDEAGVRGELEKAIRTYEGTLGYPPQSSAAPGWQCTALSLAVQDRYQFLYCSDTRGFFPFLPKIHGFEYRTLQIPTTLPTLDEVLGCDGISKGNFNAFLLSQLREDRLNVHTIHAELEGRRELSLFEDLLIELKGQKVEYMRLGGVAEEVLNQGREKIPRSPIERRPIPGRAGEVACQVSYGES